MAMITSIRAPIPLTEVPRSPRLAELHTTPGERPGDSAPVSAPIRVDAVRQNQEKPGPDDLPFQLSATAAAEAAKAAYIRARIAAGLNPLPLP